MRNLNYLPDMHGNLDLQKAWGSLAPEYESLALGFREYCSKNSDGVQPGDLESQTCREIDWFVGKGPPVDKREN
jgi:hypothetical protein